MATRKYPHSIVLKIVKFILDGLEIKDIAWKMEVSTDYIYEVRDKYFKQIWSLKRHPKDNFNLEE